MAAPPLNVDKREWALEELKRIEKENDALRTENQALKAQLGEEKPPDGGTGEIPAPAYKPGEGDV